MSRRDRVAFFFLLLWRRVFRTCLACGETRVDPASDPLFASFTPRLCRRHSKTWSFGAMYGAGPRKLAEFYTSGQVIVPRAKSYSPSRLIALLGRARGLCS